MSLLFTDDDPILLNQEDKEKKVTEMQNTNFSSF